MLGLEVRSVRFPTAPAAVVDAQVCGDAVAVEVGLELGVVRGTVLVVWLGDAIPIATV